jgi:60 kDa SS-A/Ro ribonucleoprotein
MAIYNTSAKRKPELVENHEGGMGYKLNPKHELISLMVGGDFNNTFYEKLGDREKRFTDLIDKLAKTDLEFLAKAMVYVRSTVGHRTVTHFGSTVLAKHLSGTDLGKRFFSKRNRRGNEGGIVYRLDDILEIVACYMALNPEKPLPNSMKKGFKHALETADKYELAKYQAKGKGISLVDVVNLVHPKPSVEMKDTFAKLMKGELKQFNTVEDKNTEAGKVVAQKLKSGEITKDEAEKELKVAKESNYKELIESKTIGYLALLRNLRNILKNSNDTVLIDNACRLLTDEKFIRKSLVFPHQIDLALEVLLDEFPTSNAGMRKFITALDNAYELSVPNLTELFTHGKTAVVFDTSASMTTEPVFFDGGNGRKTSKSKARDKATLIAATLAKGIGADLFHFATYCEEVKFNPLDSIHTIKTNCMKLTGRVGHGTEFNRIFDRLGKNYDRVFIISDMQGANYITPTKYNDMHIYAVQLNGYDTTMFKPNSKLYGIYGYGSDIYELVKKAEINPNALIEEINKIRI